MSISRPLNLWAPSSVVIESSDCPISVKSFLRYVDNGYIRIFGRSEWLNEPAHRASSRWPGSRWTDAFDNPIREFCRRDSALPLESRRVVTAPPESGWEWARSYLAAHPGEAGRWARLARSKAGAASIPPGTREPALAAGDDESEIAARILRDAHNHGMAIADSGFAAPFLLPGVHKKFLDILAKAPSHTPRPAPESPDPPSVDIRYSGLGMQMLEVLKFLDIHARRNTGSGRIESFIGSEGHDMLVAWMARVYNMLQSSGGRTVDGIIMRELEAELRQIRYIRPLRSFMDKKDEATVGAVSFASAMVGLATGPVDTTIFETAVGFATIAGVATAAYPIGRGLAREIGWAPADFKGIQWPFLYTYGTLGTRRQHRELQRVLWETKP
ncbi:hypothetical protein AB0C65_19855 [Nocardia sp. NPDC048505]